MSAAEAAACPHHGSDCPLLLSPEERARLDHATAQRRAVARERMDATLARLQAEGRTPFSPAVVAVPDGEP
jgi:hypothetical protein